jgi:autotransporter passenger strand-loop-strand repeat protein
VKLAELSGLFLRCYFHTDTKTRQQADSTVTTSSIADGDIGSGTVSSGETLTVQYGGTSSNVLVEAGGIEIVSGTSISDLIGPGPSVVASQIVASGGLAIGTQILSGGSATISAGGSTVGGVISGGSETVEAGATISAPVVVAGGFVTLGGGDDGGTISSGGAIDVEDYLTGQEEGAVGVTVLSGGGIGTSDGFLSGIILSGGSAYVGGEAPLYGYDGFHGTAAATQVMSGGVLTDIEGFDSGTVIFAGGREYIGPGANAIGVMISGGTLELGKGDTRGYSFFQTDQENGPIVFAGSSGTLLDDGKDAPSSVISGFNATDRILLSGVAADPNATLSVAGDMVTVSAGGTSYVMDIVGASGIPLTLGIGTTAGTIDIGVACYCAGTAILTPSGEVAVEALAAGDRVVTADGRSEPVVWVGRRSYAGRFLAGQPHLLPVRFRAGSLGGGLPRRDLLVSPCHAMLLDGLLVQAGSLTNGSSITQERGAARVDYVHIELARHDVILAEGAPSETYLDEGNRMMFANAGSYSGPSPEHSGYCAPRVSDGYRVERIRTGLQALAGKLGQAA